MKNIDSAFRSMRRFTMMIVAGSLLLCGFGLYKSYQLVTTMQSKVYILADGKAMEAFGSERKENVPVEAKDHVKVFHQYFFTLDPDEKVITANVTHALYLADQSAKLQYDNLKESGYYINLISGNVSQSILVDSVVIDFDKAPYYFRCYATQQITRTTSVVTRRLVTEGILRSVSRSENNPHGFLIERWVILENKDVMIKNR